jgi:tetratricopeptide (TPR) repeat protein
MQHSRSLRRSALLALSLLSGCAAAADPPISSGDASRAGDGGAAFLSGQFAASNGDLDLAATDYLRALASDPGSQELLQEAFLTTLLAGRPEAMRLAAELPASQAAQFLLADTDAKAGRWPQAEARFAAMANVGLAQVLRPLLVAWAQQAQGHTDAALATLRPFVQGRRLQAIYTLHAALIADLGKRAAEAARLYRIAQGEFAGTNLELGRLIASWQARAGHPDDARSTLLVMVDASPELAIALPALQATVAEPQIRNASDGIAEAYLALAAALQGQNTGNFSDVLLRLALDMRPDLTAARLVTSDVLDGRGQPDAALAVLAPVASSDPLFAVVRLRQAVLTLHKGDTDGALRILDQLARDYPKQPDVAAMQGDILRDEKHYPEAVAAYDRALAMIAHPTSANWPLFFDRGVSLDLSHQWPRAQADLLKALQLSPNQPEVLNYLGYSWTEQGRNLNKAHAMIERAAGQRPDDGAIIDSLGWVELRQGNIAGAVRMLERATELEPEDATINGHLGDAYWSAGRKLEAIYQWRRSLTLNPEPEDVPKLQAKLRNGDLALHVPPQPATPAKTMQ